jgi:hypothetical protein
MKLFRLLCSLLFIPALLYNSIKDAKIYFFISIYFIYKFEKYFYV